MIQQIKLFKKQIKALQHLRDNKTNEVLYGGGSRGGKSWLGNTWVMLETHEKPESAYLIARDTLTKLRDTTLRTWFKVLKAYGVADNYHFDAQKYIATHKHTGAIIFFREVGWYPSDPEYDRLGSYDLTGSFIDEAQETKAKVRSVLRGRYSVLEGNGWKTIPKAFYSCNPRKNWIFEDFVKPTDEGTITDDKIFIPSLVTDNPHVSKDYIENLKKADEVTRQRLLYGNFYYDDDPRKLIDYNAILDCFTNSYVQEGEKYLTGDIAFQGSDKFVVMAWSGLKVLEVFVMPKSTGKEVVDNILRMAEKHQVRRSNIIYDSDGVGLGLSGYLSGCQEFKGGLPAKNGENYQNLKTQLYYKLADYINDGKIYIKDDKFKELIVEELDQVKRDRVDKDGKLYLLSKDKVKEFLNRSPDFSDALMMRLYWEVQATIQTFNANFF